MCCSIYQKKLIQEARRARLQLMKKKAMATDQASFKKKISSIPKGVKEDSIQLKEKFSTQDPSQV